MECYSYKTLNNTNSPILNNVDIVLILTMEGSNRFNEDPFLLNLAKKTVIQYNKGFRHCVKHPIITNSKEDIIHAYYTAFEYLKEYNNVIILEDDAIVINKDPQIYDKIDKFVAVEKFNIITFGSFGLFTKYTEDFLCIDDYFFGSLQAVIYSRNSRNILTQDISSSNFNKGHMDITYIGSLDRKFTYKYPLIVQLFPKTENRNMWFSNVFLLYITNFLIALLKLDTSIDNWFFLYFIFRNYILSIKILFFIMVVLLIILTRLYYY